MRLIDAEQVHRICQFPQLIERLAQLHQQPTDEMQDLLLTQPTTNEADNSLFIRAAWQHGRAMGAKIISIMPANSIKAALPATHAVYVLLDGDNGQPLAVIDGTVMTHYKTAADSALGARYLARQDVQTMLMVGSGGIAPYLIKAHQTVRPSIKKILLWNRTTSKAEQLAKDLPQSQEYQESQVEVEVVEDLSAAVQQADLICCATRTTTPLIKGQWLRPGVHVDLVGAFTATMREADDLAIQRSMLFVNSRLTTIGEIGELIIPMKNGTISEADVLADYYDLCQGTHPGRVGDDDITILKNGGGGHMDLMTARFIYEQSEQSAENSAGRAL